MASSVEASQTYYRPYLPSDSEASDTETGSEYSPPQSPRPDNAGEDIASAVAGPDFAALALALKGPSTAQATGPSFATTEINDAYAINRIGKNVYGSYPSAVASGEPIKMNSADIPTVVVLQSLDRDKRIFVQPTDCRLMLPRIYNNISGFSIAQINLTSAFFYFTEAKGNVSLQMYENGRVLYEPAIPTTPQLDSGGNIQPLKIVNTLRNGSYNINSLMGEMTIQLNRTPLFYDFINGFSDFLALFPITGDYSLNFNEPGDTYYDSLGRNFINNPTRESICAFYFQTRYLLNTAFTLKQTLMAYYYPVLKEFILDSATTTQGVYSIWNSIQLDISYTDPAIDVQKYIIHFFQGIDDPIIQHIINNNLNKASLDKFRLYHTFRYSLINKYVCSVDAKDNSVTIQSTGLNTSLSNLLVNKYNSILAKQLLLNKLNDSTYNSLANTIISQRAIYQDMYRMLQNTFAKYFAVNYGTYSAEYYVNSNNTFILKSGLDASGVLYSYDPVVSPLTKEVNILTQFQTTFPSYWRYMINIPPNPNTGLNTGPQINMGRFDQPYPESSNFPYSLTLSNIDTTRHFIDSNSYIYTDYRRRAGDILVNVEAGKYTIFKFKSQYRQGIQVETLPRQTNFRYPVWNNANPVIYPINKGLFDVSYCYVKPDEKTFQGSNMYFQDISFNTIYGWSNDSSNTPPPNFGMNFSNSLEFWRPGVNEQINVSSSNGTVYSLTAPFVNNIRTGDICKYQFNITFYSQNTFPVDYYGFLYHDIAALAADMSPVGRRNENPYHYKQRVVFGSNTLSNTFNFQAYAGQTYYVIFRPSNLSPPATFFKVVPWMPSTAFTTLNKGIPNPLADPFTQLDNYSMAIQSDPDFIRLPILPSTLWSRNTPANIMSAVGGSTFTTIDTPIGYDSNGVSTDATDYIPFTPYNEVLSINPVATYRIDPITNYVFQYNSPYNDTTNQYFGPGNKNAIFTNAGITQYNPTAVKTRQYKIVQYYCTNYIRSIGKVSYLPTSINSRLPAYSLETTNGDGIGGYEYSSGTTDSNSFLQLGQGVCGYTFLPSDGQWAVDRLSFKTNFVNPDDPGNMNSKIHLLAIYYTSDIYSLPLTEIQLSNSIGIYLRVSERTYTQETTNIGFDSSYGTYYTFSNFPTLLQRKNASITGYTQTPGQLISDMSSYYSIVAYSLSDFLDMDGKSTWSYSSVNSVTQANLENFSVTEIQNLVGTPIPYPYSCEVSTSSRFYDGSTTPTGADLVIASAPSEISTIGYSSNIYAPSSKIASPAQSVSQYEQSIPFVNSHLHYIMPQDIIFDSNGFSKWTDLPVVPDYLHASVYNTTTFSNANSTWMRGYVMFQKEAFTIVSYKIYTSINKYTEAERKFSFMHQLSQQQIYPDHERTSLLAVSGNDSNFVFLGARESDLQLRFKVYDPISGVMTELQQNPEYIFNRNHLIQKFVFNNSNGWFYSARVANTDTVVLTGTPQYSFDSGRDPYYKSSLTYTGLFTKLQMPPSGQNLYFAYYTTRGFNTMYIYPLNASSPFSPFKPSAAGNGYKIALDTKSVPTHPFYTDLLVTLNIKIEEILFLNDVYDSKKFFKIRNYRLGTTLSSSNTNIDNSAQNFTDDNNTPISMKAIIPGALGAKWGLSHSSPYILANRNDTYDSPVAVGIAWQVFFPTIKIEMRKLAGDSSSIVDLTNITYPEWPHTCMFAYSNYDSMELDLKNKWGLERNFLVSDISFNGFYFNSYIMDIPVKDTSEKPLNDSNSYTYLAIRGYLPTESFQTMVRFYLPNRYDFGFLTLTDLIEEIALSYTILPKFNPDYAATIKVFNSNFIFSNMNFGTNTTQGLVGSNITSSNFGDFLNQYTLAYSNFSTSAVTLQIIQSTLAGEINTFITSNLQYIIPRESLPRTRFTDPILFQILWQDYLKPSYSVLDDSWGLGWNLGFSKSNTGLSTYQNAKSFYKIQDDYIYLKLNEEFNMNGLDTGSKENYTTSREPTGSTKQYYCKLLLTSFGGNATTFIHNPITFNPPLNRITNLHFQWLDSKGVVINNNDCDWSMTVTITEHYEMPELPKSMPFTLMSESGPSSGKPAESILLDKEEPQTQTETK